MKRKFVHMGVQERDLKKRWEDLTFASEGKGPLLQRDYWGVLKGCSLSCPKIVTILRERFEDFPPESLVVFQRTDNQGGQLDVGDRLEVKIRMAGKTAVRVVHVDANSITLATVKGHPEAGRITFGAYRNEKGDIIFHIRSRARSSSSKRYKGFLALGEPMQTNTWTDFIDCLAHTLGKGIIDAIYADTKEIEDEDPEVCLSPTFIARGE